MVTVRKGDGFGNRTPHLRGNVERLQRALRKAGHSVEADGLFGADTDRELKRFQRAQGLKADGIAGPATWTALRRHLPARLQRPPFGRVPGFEAFRGDLDWIHAREGHQGRPYWPGGQSGVTLDPGFDLGFQTPERTRKRYGSLLNDDQLGALSPAFGVSGPAAKPLAADPVIASIRISHAAAAKIMPHVAVVYWAAVADRFPALRDDGTPGSVQTALLSLAYNRGARNRGLGVLRLPLRAGDWLEVANRLGAMQQNHKLQGIRIRRRMEADLIRQEVELA